MLNERQGMKSGQMEEGYLQQEEGYLQQEENVDSLVPSNVTYTGRSVSARW
jgi:hypothetical protein